VKKERGRGSGAPTSARRPLGGEFGGGRLKRRQAIAHRTGKPEVFETRGRMVRHIVVGQNKWILSLQG